MSRIGPASPVPGGPRPASHNGPLSVTLAKQPVFSGTADLISYVRALARPAQEAGGRAWPGSWSLAWLVLRGLELHDQFGGNAAAVPYLNTLAFRPVPDLGRGRLAVRRPAGS